MQWSVRLATITKRGKHWFAQVRRKGHPARSKSFASKKAAARWATEQEAAILSGAAPAEVLPRTLTLRSIVERYLERVTPTKRSCETERYRLQKMLRDPICETALCDLTPAIIASYRDRRSRKVGAGTIRRELSLLNHMLDLARREWGIAIGGNPVEDVGKPRLNNARVRRIRDEEWQALRDALEQSRNRWLASIVQFAVETGMRRGEILDLRWDRIDWAASTALIPHTKTDKPRTIPLTPAAIQLLKRLPRAEDTVFPISANALKLAWVRATKRASIADLRFHDLRHEAVSRFFEIGLSLPEVALISGHRDPRMLMRYTHLHAADLAAKLADQAGARLGCFA
jgi:integrase